jgi:hypothetical protein
MRTQYLNRRKDASLADANPQAEILLRRNRELGILNQIAQALKCNVHLDRRPDPTLTQVPIE